MSKSRSHGFGMFLNFPQTVVNDAFYTENVKFKVTFRHYGKVTKCYVIDDFNGDTYTGVSKCIEGDVYNRETGEKIALEKALNKLEHKVISYEKKVKNYIEYSKKEVKRLVNIISNKYEKTIK